MKDGQRLMVKVIKNEDDLPKDEGRYFVGIKDNSEPQDIFWWLSNADAPEQAEYWLNTFDWYIIPEPELTPDMILPNDEEYERIIKGNSDKITDSDIEAWAKEQNITSQERGIIVGAKAVINGEIKHIEK